MKTVSLHLVTQCTLHIFYVTLLIGYLLGHDQSCWVKTWWMLEISATLFSCFYGKYIFIILNMPCYTTKPWAITVPNQIQLDKAVA